MNTGLDQYMDIFKDAYFSTSTFVNGIKKGSL